MKLSPSKSKLSNTFSKVSLILIIFLLLVTFLLIYDESFSVNTNLNLDLGTVASDIVNNVDVTNGISDRNGIVVAAKLVGDHDEIMLITTGGVLIRTRVSEIRELGRATQGVTLINLSEEEKLSGIEKIVESDHLDDDQDDLPI